MNSFQILREIGDALNSSLEPGEIFKIVLDKCIKFTRSDTGSIITIDKETRILHIEHQVGLGTNAEERVKLRIGEGVTGTAAKEKKPLMVNDVARSPVYVTVNRAIKSEIAVPIIFKNRLLGVISVDSKALDNYKKEDLELLTIVGAQVGQVLTNLEYFQDLRLRLTHDEILMEINRVLSSSLDMTNTLEEALVILKKSGLFERGALILPSPGSEFLEMKANFGYSKTESARATYQVNEGVVGGVYKAGKPEAIKDIKTHPSFLDKTDSRKNEKRQLSFFCIPLISGAQTIGIMIFDQIYSNAKSFENSFEFLKKLETQISKSLQIHFLARKEKTELQQENQALKNILTEKTQFSNIIGRSEKMKHVFDQLQAVSSSESTVLITGESGTGKELVAAAIHFHSPRKDRAFSPINCAAIPENLLESELFGYKKGAFTGAIADKPGKFKLADGGTIFLDEIGEMPL
ncbi:MAG: sigma 54-interacting transcriptional regulator, partial [Spirochaetia bacterium]|nr:sigma 54-interacting transcriptional regulator [Spirochaetia bacterium]